MVEATAAKACYIKILATGFARVGAPGTVFVWYCLHYLSEALVWYRTMQRVEHSRWQYDQHDRNYRKV